MQLLALISSTLKKEIPVVARMAQAEPQPALLSLVDDGKYLLLQNATPATSVTVVDLEKGEQIAEIPTPGCWGILPMVNANTFTTICGDGTFATYSWNADGTFGEPAKSEQIFDVDADALCTNPAATNAAQVFSFSSPETPRWAIMGTFFP